jgi:hypothetical protein
MMHGQKNIKTLTIYCEEFVRESKSLHMESIPKDHLSCYKNKKGKLMPSGFLQRHNNWHPL